MLSRTAKAAFYAMAGPAMAANGFLYRQFRAPRNGTVKVHLGPGQQKYIEGWINIDANMFTAKCDVWADLRNPLPFVRETVDAIYSHHMIEHLPNIKAHLTSVLDCLKRGGVYRIAGPNGDSAIRKYIEKDHQWFDDFPDCRRSIGGRFENFVFCRGEHLTILTASFLEELMLEAGFSHVNICKPAVETQYPELFDECVAQEHESDHITPHTLVIEGVKRM